MDIGTVTFHQLTYTYSHTYSERRPVLSALGAFTPICIPFTYVCILPK